MKICFGKQNSEIFSNYNEPDLRVLFPILEEIKEQQYKAIPKQKYDSLDTLFDIITHVSLLHNQIFHLVHTEITKRQFDHILQLNKFNLEKSISDFFIAFTSEPVQEIKINQLSKKHIKDKSPEKLFKKEKDILLSKLNKHNDMQIKQYLCVNRSMRCNSQLNMKKQIDTSSNYHEASVSVSNSKSDIKTFNGLCPNSEKKAKYNPLMDSLKKMPSKTLYSKTQTCLNRADKKYQKKPLALITEVKKHKSKLYLSCKSYQSFDRSKDASEFRDIAKPSNYTRYLLQKYKDVVETYGDELRTSLNSSMKRPKSSNKRDTSKSFDHSPMKVQDERKRQNSSNCFVKITNLPHH